MDRRQPASVFVLHTAADVPCRANSTYLAGSCSDRRQLCVESSRPV